MKILLFVISALGLTFAIMLYAPREIFIPNSCFPQDGPCVVKSEGRVITFSIDKKEINPVTDINYTLNIKGFDADHAELLLVGKSMHMDQELIKLEKINTQSFSIRRVFPKCEEKEMVWKGVLSVVKDKLTVKTVFDFRVSRK